MGKNFEGRVCDEIVFGETLFFLQVMNRTVLGVVKSFDFMIFDVMKSFLNVGYFEAGVSRKLSFKRAGH